MFIILGFLFSGCALLKPKQSNSYADKLDTWIGESADDLIVELGPPAQTAVLSDGSKVLVFSKSAAGPTLISGYGNMAIARQKQNWCSTTFVVAPDNKIKTWKIAGNSCG